MAVKRCGLQGYILQSTFFNALLEIKIHPELIQNRFINIFIPNLQSDNNYKKTTPESDADRGLINGNY